MQLKIYGKVTIVLIALILSLIGIGALIIFNFAALGSYKMLVIGGFIVYAVICFFGFKMYEKNADKYLIQKMVLKGQIALANIKKAAPLKAIRESSGKYYVLWELEVEFFDQQFNRFETSIIEKFNPMHEKVPNGTVYITHDEAKPERKFIVQNVMISHVATLAPIVHAYEKNKRIPIKYLNVYYKDGLIVETYKESLRNQKKEEQKNIKVDHQ